MNILSALRVVDKRCEMKMTVLCDRVNGYGSFEIPFGNIIVIESLFLGDMELEPDEYSVKGKEVTVPMDDHDTPVTIVFIAGYGKESIGVPAAIRSALLAMFNRNFNADAENQVKRIAQSFRVRKM